MSVTSCAWQWRVGVQTFCPRNPRTRASATYLVRDGNAGSGLHASQRNEPTQGICPQGNLIGPCRHATANARSAGPVPFNSWSFRRRPRRLPRILVPHLLGIICFRVAIRSAVTPDLTRDPCMYAVAVSGREHSFRTTPDPGNDHVPSTPRHCRVGTTRFPAERANAEVIARGRT